MKNDFIYLRVRGHLERYKNPPVDWEEHVLDWTSKVVLFLKNNELLLPQAKAWVEDIKDVEIRLSDLSELGKDFIMSSQVEKWLQSYDRQKNKNPSKELKIEIDKLQVRFEKFSSTRENKKTDRNAHLS